MEESLISEVERRPILYDKRLGSYKKLNAREKAWNQVARILGIKEFECRRRWRTLRDSFIKLYRSTKNTEGGRKKQWIYYNQMTFLIPHIEPKVNCEEIVDQEISESGTEELQIDESLSQEITEALEGDNYLTLLNHDDSTTTTGGNQTFKKRKRSTDSYRKFDTAARSYDPEEQFLLSCAPSLRRLNHRQNAIAKMKILHLLYELEFETNEDGRPPSSASVQSGTSQDDSKDLSSLLTPVTVVEDGQEDNPIKL